MSKVLEGLAHELWAAAQLAPGEGIADGVARLAELLAQPAEAEGVIQCPASHPAECYAPGTQVVHASLVHGIVRQADALSAALSAVTAERDRLANEAERLRMQLVACGVVAMANTPESAAKSREMHPDYMSASCQDVMRAVDSEMSLRAETEELRKDAELYRRLRDLPDDQVGTAGVPCVGVPRGPFSGTYVSGAELDAAMAAKEA